MSKVDEVVEERGGIYGHPYDNFANIAALWTEYLHARFPEIDSGYLLSREDIAHMMILMKVARTIHDGGNDDTITDIAGYAKCIQMIRERENEQP